MRGQPLVMGSLIFLKALLYLNEHFFHAGCSLEGDSSYPGNGSVNNGKLETQPDLDSCRILCQFYKTKYFTWRGPTNDDTDTRLQCWCKKELRLDNKKIANGVFTGDTVCDGEGMQIGEIS